MPCVQGLSTFWPIAVLVRENQINDVFKIDSRGSQTIRALILLNLFASGAKLTNEFSVAHLVFFGSVAQNI